MKKRLLDGEIEQAKKSSRIIVIIIIMMISLLVGFIIYVGYLYQQGLIFQREDGEFVIKNSDEQIIKGIELDKEDTNVLALFNIVKVTNDYFTNETYTNQTSVDVSKLPIKEKFLIAKNKYKEYAIYDSTIDKTYIKEDKVKESFNSIFGNGSYEKQETIPYGLMNDLMYDSRYEYYFLTGRQEDSDGSLKSFEKVLSVQKIKNALYIKSAVLYYEKVNHVLCKDITCEDYLEQLSPMKEYTDDYFELYLEHNQEKLVKIQYKFELDDTNFYEYKGYERLNP